MSKKNKARTDAQLVPVRALEAYLHKILHAVALPKRDMRAIREDFLRLFSFYTKEGLSPEEIKARIGDNILGRFYRTPKRREWMPLDSAAKVYPLSVTPFRMTVFRVSAYMDRDIEPCVLQVALLSTIKRFPFFASTVKRGVFWHYLDALRCRFAVREETEAPCAFMQLRKNTMPCFSVLYYKNRIALEVFHALTDGTGALVLLKTLVGEYLRLLGEDIPKENGIMDVSEAPMPEEAENAFGTVIKKKEGGGFIQKPAIQPGKGKRKLSSPRVRQFIMPGEELYKAAGRYGVTVTAFVAACIMKAVQKCVYDAENEEYIQVQVPVNMRRFYPTKTLRNFSLYAVLQNKYGDTTEMHTLCKKAAEELRNQLSPDALGKMLSSANRMVTTPIIRYMPLVFKAAALRKAYSILGEKVLSSTLSNLGRVENDFGGHVLFMDAIIGASCKTNSKCALITYKETAVLSVTESVKDNGFTEALYEILGENGIEAVVEGTQNEKM